MGDGMATHQVTVVTGTATGAGTDSAMVIDLQGDKGSSGQPGLRAGVVARPCQGPQPDDNQEWQFSLRPVAGEDRG